MLSRLLLQKINTTWRTHIVSISPCLPSIHKISVLRKDLLLRNKHDIILNWPAFASKNFSPVVFRVHKPTRGALKKGLSWRIKTPASAGPNVGPAKNSNVSKGTKGSSFLSRVLEELILFKEDSTRPVSGKDKSSGPCIRQQNRPKKAMVAIRPIKSTDSMEESTTPILFDKLSTNFDLSSQVPKLIIHMDEYVADDSRISTRIQQNFFPMNLELLRLPVKRTRMGFEEWEIVLGATVIHDIAALVKLNEQYYNWDRTYEAIVRCVKNDYVQLEFDVQSREGLSFPSISAGARFLVRYGRCMTAEDSNAELENEEDKIENGKTPEEVEIEASSGATNITYSQESSETNVIDEGNGEQAIYGSSEDEAAIQDVFIDGSKVDVQLKVLSNRLATTRQLKAIGMIVENKARDDTYGRILQRIILGEVIEDALPATISQGQPGTGKSFTAAVTCVGIAQLGYKVLHATLTKADAETVLLSIFNATQKLFETVDNQTIRRKANNSELSNTLRTKARNWLATLQRVREGNPVAAERFVKEEINEIEEVVRDTHTKIIISTCNNSAALRDMGFQPQVVVIDGASSAREPDGIIPLIFEQAHVVLYGNAEKKRVLPWVRSLGGNEFGAQLSRSLFERLVGLGNIEVVRLE
ncbi:putative upf1 regulator of nonsense protein [Botrytis fragariae]|uniref:Putative upf1 regulator of nonsense protein n=1 Tax=Botrytis fragariae TaxID=1964551 RepID=A0A8H6ED85_9HELO|nr:putative upf1 regulator of nonsense protein [Botrytis fragariae]KAF5867570.1 putative upf1 regulator of nonsense protein [Botrytis fragariae]